MDTRRLHARRAPDSLVIDVDDIEAPRQPFDRRLPAAALEEDLAAGPYRAAADAEVALKLTRLSGRDVLLEGRSTLAVESACRRCLAPVRSSVPSVFTLTLVARPLDASGKPRKAADDDGEEARSASFDDREVDEEPFDGERIDLAPILREQLLLSLPDVEPLCSEACKGLCATCGQDLNAGACGHRPGGPDPRWAALGKLKVD